METPAVQQNWYWYWDYVVVSNVWLWTHTPSVVTVCVCLGLNVHKQSRRSSLPSLPFLLCLSFTLSSCSASIFSVTPSLSPSDSVSLCCALFQISSSSLPGRRYKDVKINRSGGKEEVEEIEECKWLTMELLSAATCPWKSRKRKEEEEGGSKKKVEDG